MAGNSILLPELAIPDDIVITADNDNCTELWPDVSNLGIFDFTLRTPEDLLIKYCEDRYEVIGDEPDITVEPCPDLCGVGGYFDCASGTCVPYSSFNFIYDTLTYVEASGISELSGPISHSLSCNNDSTPSFSYATLQSAISSKSYHSSITPDGPSNGAVITDRVLAINGNTFTDTTTQDSDGPTSGSLPSQYSAFNTTICSDTWFNFYGGTEEYSITLHYKRIRQGTIVGVK